MQRTVSVYIKGDSFIHRLDPRAKLVILAVYSCALFFVSSWWGMALMGALFACALGASRIPFGRIFGCGAIIYVLAAFAILFNAVRFEDGVAVLSAVGFDVGCLYAARILLLFWVSILLCFTSTSTDLTIGFAKLLSPLRMLHVPVDDLALVLSLALRFIPLASAEFVQIRQAQRARCAHFDDGTLWQRLQAADNSFVPLFVSLFRRADRLALAMDARCYGLARPDVPSAKRTSFRTLRMTARDAGTLFAAMGFCVSIALFL